jgi:ubiquinol-cytochrome c reductase cytochrome b subunit
VLFGLPLLFGGYLAALPFIDKKGSSRGRRIFLLSPFALVLVVIVGLTALSYRDDMTSDSFHAARELADKRAARALELAADGVPPAGPLAMLAADPQTRGPELFDKHCAVCHKLNDHGPEPGKETAPDLTGFGTARWAAAVMVDPDADSLFGKTAFKEMMPSMTKPPKDPEAAEYFTAMNKADLDAVAEFLAAEARGEKTKGHAGEKLTKDRCTSCHRLDGKTDDDTSLAPELRGWGSLAWIEAQIANPGSGKTYPPGVMDEELKGHMPAYQDQLSPLEVEMLAQWLYEQARGE